MQAYEPTEINQLFLRQVRNLTRFDTVYVEDRDASRAVEDLLSSD